MRHLVAVLVNKSLPGSNDSFEQLTIQIERLPPSRCSPTLALRIHVVFVLKPSYDKDEVEALYMDLESPQKECSFSITRLPLDRTQMQIWRTSCCERGLEKIHKV